MACAALLPVSSLNDPRPHLFGAWFVHNVNYDSAEAERGKDGPGLRYLTPAEFESIRRLGVRLGTKGELLAAQCDFCLHCVKLEALQATDAHGQ